MQKESYSRADSSPLFSGKSTFFTGCNYWASHAGTFMWRNWDADRVEKDFQRLSAHKARVLRVFPLWCDFQPLTLHFECGQTPCEYRMGEEALPDTPFGQAGIDPVMMERFHTFCRLAEKYQLKLIVGLITGWMSGRVYAPAAFEKKNLLTDPEVIHFQVKFIRTFVRDMKEEKAIAAWDWGNECNCLGPHSVEEMWLWQECMSNAILREDSSRPIISGLHGDKVPPIQAAGECADILCTHPYPAFTPHCEIDPLDSFRSAFHAPAQTLFYMGAGRKKAFVEEIGSYSSSYASPRTASAYLRNAFWNTYTHNCYGALWWCANDQNLLTQTPYAWVAMERELGLLKADGTPKPTLLEMEKFTSIAEENILPPHQADALILVPSSDDRWGPAYMSFLLAKEAGFTPCFATAEDPLPEKDLKLYILPSCKGYGPVGQKRFYELLAKVEEGAALLVTSDGGTFEPFAPFGIEVESTCKASTCGRLLLEGEKEELVISRSYHIRLMVEQEKNVRILGRDEENRPVFTCAEYGKGKILFLGMPLEWALMDRANSFGENAPAFYKVYEKAMEIAGVESIVKKSARDLTFTIHPFPDGKMTILAFVNNSKKEMKEPLQIAPAYKVVKTVNGSFDEGSSLLSIGAKEGAILYLQKV